MNNLVLSVTIVVHLSTTTQEIFTCIFGGPNGLKRSNLGLGDA